MKKSCSQETLPFDQMVARKRAHYQVTSLLPARVHERLHISKRQYARIVRDWVTSIGLEASAYGKHSMRRTKVTQISTKRPATSVLYSFCLATRRWTARSGTSVSS